MANWEVIKAARLFVVEPRARKQKIFGNISHLAVYFWKSLNRPTILLSWIFRAPNPNDVWISNEKQIKFHEFLMNSFDLLKRSIIGRLNRIGETSLISSEKTTSDIDFNASETSRGEM